jgi:hypothetical protein
MHYKVIKGTHPEKAIMDSSFPDKKRADARAKVLKDSLRGQKNIKVWVLPLEEGEQMNYRRSKGGPWTNYNAVGPKIIK